MYDYILHNLKLYIYQTQENITRINNFQMWDKLF
jgi:hypothetical protein